MRTITESDDLPHNASTSPSDRPVPRRRWLRRLALGGAVLLILLAAAPYVVGPLWGPAILAAVGDSQIRGALRVQRVSLSWFSPVELDGVRLAHPDGTTVLEVASVRLGSGLLGVLSHGENFERLEVRHPRVRLERSPSGEFTLAEALASARPSTPRKEKASDKKPAQPAGRLVVIDGEVDFRPPGAQPILTSELNLDCTLETLNAIHANVSGTVGPAASLVAEITVANLMPAGKLDLDSAVVTATLYTGAPVDLGALFAGEGISGRLEAKADARMEKGRVKTAVAVGLTGLAAAKGSPAPPRPVNLAVRCEANAGPGELTALAEMQGDVGDLKMNLAYRRGEKPTALVLSEHIEALVQGRVLPLPDMTAEASGGLDFARLAGAIPALANVRPDARIEQCRLEFQDLRLQGGPRPALNGRVLLSPLKARVADSLVEWDAAQAELAVWTDPAGRIRIDKAKFQLGGELLHAQVSGQADDISLNARADVAKLHQRLGQVFRLQDFTARGQFDLAARLRRPRNETLSPGELRASVEATMQARQVAFRKSGRPVDAFALSGDLAWKADLAKNRDAFSGQGDLTLTNGALTLAGEEVTLDRLAFEHELSYDRSRRDLTLRRLRLACRALNLDAKGELRDLGRSSLVNVTGQYSADWTALTPLLHQFDDRTPDSFAALKDMAGAFAFNRGSDGVAASFGLTGAVGKLDFQLNAPRLSALRAMDTGAFLAAAAAGEPVPALPEAHVKLAGVLDLAVLFQATPPGAIQATHPHPCAGTLEFRDVACTLGEKPALGGAIALSKVSVLFQGQTSPFGEALLDLSTSTDATGRFRADKLALTAPGLTVNASGTPTAVRLDVAAHLARVGELYFPWLGRREVLQGDFAAKGTLARENVSRKFLQADMTARFDRAGFVPSGTPTPAVEPTELTATVSYAGRIDWSDGLASTGTLLARDVLFQAPGIRQQQQLMTAVHEFRVDKPGERLALRRLEISFQPAWFSINAAGEITQLKTRRLLDIKGKYTGDWDEICRVIRAFKPDVPIPTKFLFSGTTEGLFTVTGPMEHPAILSNYRDMTADAGFGWTTARTMGLELGQAKFRPTLKDGIMVLPLTEITASGGLARLGATVDVRGQQAILSLPPNLQVLQQIRLTEQFTHEMLSRANPVFAGLGAIQGTLSLRMTSLRVPLDETAQTQAVGAGRLDLTDVRFRPGGLVAQLLALAGVAGGQEVVLQPTGVDFRIARGAIEYENFRVAIDKSFDLIFSGRVGFNDSLSMSVSVPVHESLLRKLGASGPLGDYARLLRNARVTIPLTGTRESPVLDFKRVKIDALLRQATEALLREEAGKFLKR